jgi:hypothetical protein
VLTIQRRGGGDVEPVLLCTACQKALSLKDAWLAFDALTEAQPQSQGKWVHKRCADGEAERLFQSRRITLWRGRDVLDKLLRATEG